MTIKFLAGCIILALCLIIASPAQAQNAPTPEKKALIKELSTLMNPGNASEAIALQFLEQFQQSSIILIKNDLREWIEAQNASPAEKKRLESQMEESAQRILARLRAEFPKRIKLGEILEQAVLEVYDKYFTEAEVKDLVAFYKTPTGQKIIRILPQISAEMLPRIGQLIDPAANQLAVELLEDEIKRLTGKQN
ncbi:MAG TPA: DUF2059 domain-containing protein [Blastocatellia bacterium]